jgi:hypothetical protein
MSGSFGFFKPSNFERNINVKSYIGGAYTQFHELGDVNV